MDEKIIELYEHYETCKAVADELGISREKVRATLIKHGIPRTHRHPKPEPKFRRNYDLDIGEITRLYEEGNSLMEIGELFGCNWMTVNRRLKAAGVDIRRVGINRIDISLEDVIPLIDEGLTQEEAAKRLGCSVATVKNRLYEAGIKSVREYDLPVDEIAAMFDGGETLSAIGEAFGCSGETIRRRLKAIGYEFASCEAEPWPISAEEREAEFVKRLSQVPGCEKYEYVGGFSSLKGKVTIRCKSCGAVGEYIAKGLLDKRHGIHKCPECLRIEKEREKERRKEERERELAKDKVCVECGKVFHSEWAETRYCSKSCRDKKYDGSHRKKARKFKVEYDGSISWRSLSERLGHCNCEICGESCDPNDHSWGGNFGPLYPSVDCIVPMSKGGGYTWGNVQLAHCICNSAKRDLLDDEEIEKAVARYA